MKSLNCDTKTWCDETKKCYNSNSKYEIATKLNLGQKSNFVNILFITKLNSDKNQLLQFWIFFLLGVIINVTNCDNYDEILRKRYQTKNCEIELKCVKKKIIWLKTQILLKLKV